jgi:RNA recognition motif-containing protein
MSENTGICLYVGNIPYNCTEDDLRQRVIGYGPIMSIKLFQNSGYGFLYFKNENDAKSALTNLNGKDFNGRELRVSRAKYGFKKTDSLRKCTQENRLYVGNIPYDCSEQDVKMFFSIFGEVLNVELVRSFSNPKLSRGFGFITYGTFEEAQNAIKNGHRRMLEGRKLKVSSAHDKIDYKKQRQEMAGYYNYYYWHMYQMYQSWKEIQQPAAGLYPPLRGSTSRPFEKFGLASVDSAPKFGKALKSPRRRKKQYKNIRTNQVSRAKKQKMKN